MIHEVDSALRGLILREGLDGTGAEVVFDAPTKDWASRRGAIPTVDVYLYDIREDVRRRQRGVINEYDADRRRVVARRLPPRYVKLSYLITAWTSRPVDEHRLLSSLLACFLRHDAVPADLLAGPLAVLGLPVPVSVALPPPEDRSFADVWSALGGELKPSLDIVVSVPTDSGQRRQVGPPVSTPPQVSVGGAGSWPPREVRQGRPRRAAAAGSGQTGPGDTEPAGTEPGDTEPGDTETPRPAMRRHRGSTGG